jgi:hypothetical protein
VRRIAVLRGQQAVYLLTVAAVALAACGSDEDAADVTDSAQTQVAATDPPATDPPATDPPATDPPATDPPATDPPATDPPATDPPVASEQVAYAESVIDAFYSYDPVPLEAAVGGIAGADFVLFYQGWAEGANYEVVNRAPCVEGGDQVNCDITVKDDLIGALGIDFNVTDSFHFQFDEDGKATQVFTTSNDPPEFRMAFDWTFKQKPELREAECQGLFAGGPTPGACAEQVVAAFAEYASPPDETG